MVKRQLFLMVIGCLSLVAADAQDMKAYQVYNKNKNEVTFSAMAEALSRYDIVLFGEYHNDAMMHWLELRTAEELYRLKKEKLILGAEMFERDNQEQVDRYLSGDINEQELEKEARLWQNFHTDYKPLLDFAKAHHLPFIATNIPRRYAAVVAKYGLDSLSHIPQEEKQYMAKMPIKVTLATPGYQEVLTMMKDHAGDKAMNFVAAQAVKDATMAASIRRYARRKILFLHFNGDYHSKAYGGIYWYLKKKKKRLKIAVISVAQSDSMNLPLPEELIPTEFNIVVPADMTKTY